MTKSCTVEISKGFCSCGHTRKEHWHGGCRVCICDSYDNMSELIKDDSFVTTPTAKARWLSRSVFVRNTLENADVISSLTRASIDDSIEIAEDYFDLYDDSFYEFAESSI